ncbi:MAG: hypothetical protein JW809_04670 [Pirellulales bacterium]|nr:hypothetical protein [Pirellulales bacterium]
MIWSLGRRRGRAALLVCPAAVVLIASASAAAPITMIDNGASSNRVDVVFLGDGYTAAQIGSTYVQHINDYIDYFFRDVANSDPFHRYRNFFNVHRIDVVSNESGADVPPQGIYRDTALDASYFFDGETDRLLYVNTTKADAALATGLAGAGFTAEMRYVAVNDTRYGGGGGSYAVYAAGNSAAREVALHEMGHSFSGLADEYGGDPNPYTGGEPSAVNVTKDPTGAKWAQWLGYEQPGIGTIGAYEGGYYHDAGVYRPSLNSKMRSLNQPFNAVSREKIILDIYTFVDPLDAWDDNGAPLVDPGAISVATVDDEVIQLEWFVDGELVPEATGATFDLTQLYGALGQHAISVRAFDPTGFDPVDGWVRRDQDELEQFVSWDVTLTTSTLLPGDANADRAVNNLDAAVVAAHWLRAAGAAWQDGDFSGDGAVDDLDLAILAANWDEEPSTTAVPEPGAMALLVFGLVVMPLRGVPLALPARSRP